MKVLKASGSPGSSWRPTAGVFILLMTTKMAPSLMGGATNGQPRPIGDWTQARTLAFTTVLYY